MAPTVFLITKLFHVHVFQVTASLCGNLAFKSEALEKDSEIS